jgi:hypothetical protein
LTWRRSIIWMQAHRLDRQAVRSGKALADRSQSVAVTL